MRLITLGRLALLGGDGAEVPLLGHRHKLVLLAFLALSDAPVARDTLIRTFWPEDYDERSRRHSLSNALSFLRGRLGARAITGNREQVALAPGAVDVDAVELLSAATSRDFTRVLEVYGGAFLDGVSVTGSPELDRWLERMHDAIARAALRAAEFRCNATAHARAWDACASAARTWLEIEPRSPQAALHLLNAVRAARTPEARRLALFEYDKLSRRLATEFGTAPDAGVMELARRIEARVAAEGVGGADNEMRASAPVPAPPEPSSEAALVTRLDATGGKPDGAAAIDIALERERPASRWHRRTRLRVAGVITACAVLPALVVGALATNLPVTPGLRALTHRTMQAGAATPAAPRFAGIGTANAAAHLHFVRGEQAYAEGRFAEGVRELDAAIALDSGFGSALLARLPIAVSTGDGAAVERLRAALAHARFTAWDMLAQAADSAQFNGEQSRAEALYRELVERYPRDPRAYSALGDMYMGFGALRQADSVYRRELALDSTGAFAAGGPCVPCHAYASLIAVEAQRGDLAGAERTARRWLALQPAVPAAWAALASILASSDRFAAARDAEHRAALLSGSDPAYAGRIARELIAARQFDAADSVIAPLLANHAASGAGLRDAGTHALALLERERGQLRASIHTLDRIDDIASLFERMDAFARLGKPDAAERLFHAQIARFDPSDALGDRAGVSGLTGNTARAFCWSRALEAEAIAGGGDTIKLHALADSIRDVSVRSYYGRDWRLYHHVLGRIAMVGGRYADAEREFEATRWGAAGWTASLAWLARAQLAQGHPLDAVTTLRQARAGVLDAMGRYEPKSELDYLTAIAYQAAGRDDSAGVYAKHARSAWRHADPEVRQLLSELR